METETHLGKGALRKEVVRKQIERTVENYIKLGIIVRKTKEEIRGEKIEKNKKRLKAKKQKRETKRRINEESLKEYKEFRGFSNPAHTQRLLGSLWKKLSSRQQKRNVRGLEINK